MVQRIRIESIFPDSTRRGSAELGDYDQVAIALVLIPLYGNKWRRETRSGLVMNVGLKVQYIISGSRIRHINGLGLREMEYFLIWCTWTRQGLVNI